MLWYKPENIPFMDKVKEGMAYYEKKYGKVPKQCHIHPDVFESTKDLSLDGITLVPNKIIRPNHFWFLPDEVKQGA